MERGTSDALGVCEDNTQSDETSEWTRAHEALSRLAKARAKLDSDEGQWMLCALRSRAHTHLGFASFSEYIERLFGYKPRSTEEKLRVAEALEHLPELDLALQNAELCWSAVRELTRVATPEDERQWLEAARGKSQRHIEHMVAGRRLGDGPHEKPSGERRHVLRFDVSGETMATFRDAMEKLRRQATGRLDDDSALLLLARSALEGPRDSGRSSYQIAIAVCETCGRASQQSQGEDFEIDAAAVEMAECDAQHIGSVGPSDSRAHVGADPESSAEAATESVSKVRATQTIPPAVRRAVMRRDGGRCKVPGCTHARYVDVHHLDLRSEGGEHDRDRLIVLCSAHHRAFHRGEILASGTVSAGLVFRHADGSTYGRVAIPNAAAAYSKAFDGLRRLGFREGETRRALARVQELTDVPAETESVLREALRILSGASYSVHS